MNIPKELQELRADVDQLVNKYKEVRAISPETTPNHDQMKDLEDLIFRMTQYTHERINKLEDRIYEYMYIHSKGHIPPVSGTDKMENVLKILLLDKDYQVFKPMIAAASAKYGFEVK